MIDQDAGIQIQDGPGDDEKAGKSKMIENSTSGSFNIPIETSFDASREKHVWTDDLEKSYLIIG